VEFWNFALGNLFLWKSALPKNSKYTVYISAAENKPVSVLANKNNNPIFVKEVVLHELNSENCTLLILDSDCHFSSEVVIISLLFITQKSNLQ
jgi:hypothetical protein